MTRHLVFIGDSLTQWFDWQRRFPDQQVMNLGISGETVQGLLNRRENIRSRVINPDYIFLMTGINNIANEEYEILPPYREIIRNFTAWYKKTTTVIQSILPVDLEWIDPNVIRNTNRNLEQIAREFNTEYLDVHRHFTDSQGNVKGGLLDDDGVHLSSKGYEVWADELERFLKYKSKG